VYATDLWAQPLTDPTGRFRDCTPEWYRTNEAQTHRLVPWLNRELLVLLELSGQQARQAHLIQLIMDWVKIYPVLSPELRDQLLPYLGVRTEHFQHELHNFARTPFDLTGYDRNVTYSAARAAATVAVTSGSSSEEEVGGDDPAVQFIDEVGALGQSD
jgi:E3 ubiquitin-protein ligase Topors